MPLINLVVVLIIVGVALYLINRYIPMASSIKTILNVLVVVVVCVWLLQATGMWGSVTSFRCTGESAAGAISLQRRPNPDRAGSSRTNVQFGRAKQETGRHRSHMLR
jgi:hypothetical protein